MDYKLIVIISFTFLYGLFEIFMSVRQRRKLKIVKSGDRFSIWILSISIAIGYWISFSFASTQVGRIRYWDSFFALGLILISVGLIIRIKSISTLKQHFTYAVNKIEDHELIEVGLYRNIRHPGYLGQLIIFLGISISLSNWISILSMMIAILCGYIYRINTEEKFLVAQMGTIYINYQRRTKKLIPKLY